MNRESLNIKNNTFARFPAKYDGPQISGGSCHLNCRTVTVTGAVLLGMKEYSTRKQSVKIILLVITIQKHVLEKLYKSNIVQLGNDKACTYLI